MKNFVCVVMCLIALFVGSVSAIAQTAPPTTPVGTPTNSPVSVVPTGINVSLYVGGWYGTVKPVGKDAYVVVSPIRRNQETGLDYVDLERSKRFGPCKGLKTNNCIRKDWTGFITDEMLPQGDEGAYNHEYDFRGESEGYYHWIENEVRVVTPGGWNAYAPSIPMFDTGVSVQKLKIWWITDKVFAIGFWVKSNWPMDFKVDFIFSGSALTRSEVDYGMVSTEETMGPEWKWIGVAFNALPNNYYSGVANGALCGEVQLRELWSNDWVDAKKKICFPAYNPPSPLPLVPQVK